MGVTGGVGVGGGANLGRVQVESHLALSQSHYLTERPQIWYAASLDSVPA